MNVDFGTFKGEVTIQEPLSLEACLAIEDARQRLSVSLCPEARRIQIAVMDARDDKNKQAELDGVEELSKHLIACVPSDNKPRCVDSPSGAARDKIILGALLVCVKKWSVAGVPDKPTSATFPGAPRKDSAELISAIWNEVWGVYLGEELDKPDPNA